MSNLLQSIPEGRIVRFPSHTPTLQADTNPKLPGLRGPKARRHRVTNSPHHSRRASYKLPSFTPKARGLIYYSFFRKGNIIHRGLRTPRYPCDVWSVRRINGVVVFGSSLSLVVVFV